MATVMMKDTPILKNTDTVTKKHIQYILITGKRGSKAPLFLWAETGRYHR